MLRFDKNSSEWEANGHYFIDEKNWYSIDTFKQLHSINPHETPDNLAEAILINEKYNEYYQSTPDDNAYPMVYIYPEEVLEKFYEINVK